MTPAERIRAEKDRIEKNGNIYIPPFRMANLMKAAGKIVDLIWTSLSIILTMPWPCCVTPSKKNGGSGRG